MTRRVLVVRHPPVAPDFSGVCYGASDVPLGASGLIAAGELARALAREPVTHLFHSGLSRAAAVAERLAALTGLAAVPDIRLRERDFGAWELASWDAIYAETGDAMTGMLTDPAGWRPPGGETTFELRDRAAAWFRGLPAVGVVVAVTHGGPIATLRGALAGAPVADWPRFIPPPGGVVDLTSELVPCDQTGSEPPVQIKPALHPRERAGE